MLQMQHTKQRAGGYANSNPLISFSLSIWWLDSTGQTKRLQTTAAVHQSPSFSPDGKHLAFELASGPRQSYGTWSARFRNRIREE